MVFQKVIDNWLFIAPSKKKFKKYDVYDNRTRDYITSFGQLKQDGTPFTQFHDKITYYSDYNNNDKRKRDNYRKRHKNDKIDDTTTSGFFSWYFLW